MLFLHVSLSVFQLCLSKWSQICIFHERCDVSICWDCCMNSVKPSSLLVWLIDKCVCVCVHKLAPLWLVLWYSVCECERKCGLNLLTWLSCCAATGRGGRVIQVLECEVPIELWKWELSREMGIAPCWFVTFAMLFGAFSVCIHHSFNQNVCVCVSHWLHYVIESVFSLRVCL